VLDAIRESGRPVVGHNASFDLAYSLAQFAAHPLPRAWAEYKALVRASLPGGLYDTKHLAAQLSAAHGLGLGDTSLGGLYGKLMDEGWLRASVSGVALATGVGRGRGGGGGGGVPEVLHAPGHGGYAGLADPGAKAHEAGFDAFMTGAVFARLLRIAEVKAARGGLAGEDHAPQLVPAPGTAPDGGGAAAAGPSSEAAAAAERDALLQPVLPYCGRVHVNRSDLPYYDLYGAADPVVSRPAVLHVAGFTPGTRPYYLLQRFQAAGLGPLQ
ncbi:hypothetical protein TSOC_015479, partial [Tetrabaena socialis]